MSDNDDRYSKLELDKKKGPSKKKTSKFKRKLEIFGLPKQKKQIENTKSRTDLDDLTPPPEPKDHKTKSVQTKRKSRRSRPRQSPIVRERIRDKLEDLQDQASEALQDQRVQQNTKYDDMLERNRHQSVRQKREIRRKAEISYRREQAASRVSSARSTLMWSAIIIVGLVVMFLESEGGDRALIIELGLGILFAYLGFRSRRFGRRGRRWWW